jgi:hypothetical protein
LDVTFLLRRFDRAEVPVAAIVRRIAGEVIIMPLCQVLFPPTI